IADPIAALPSISVGNLINPRLDQSSARPTATFHSLCDAKHVAPQTTSIRFPTTRAIMRLVLLSAERHVHEAQQSPAMGALLVGAALTHTSAWSSLNHSSNTFWPA